MGCQNKQIGFYTRFFYFETAVPTGCARVPLLVRMHHMKTQFSWVSPAGTHGEYADKQLANLQKRICLIEYLRLGLVNVCQGAKLGLPKLQPTLVVGFNFAYSYRDENRRFGASVGENKCKRSLNHT